MNKKTNKRSFFTGLTFNVIAFIVVLLIVVQLVVSAIGYLQFTDSLAQEYNESAYLTAKTAAAYLENADISAYLSAKEDINNGVDSDIVKEYDNLLKKLDVLCDTQNANVVYVIALKSDYRTIISIFNSPNKNSGYTAWEIGKEINAKEVENDAFYDVYKNIYENGLERGTVMRTENLNGVVPHVTSVIPLKSGETVTAVICVQRTMFELNAGRARYLRYIILTTVLFIIVGTVFALLHVRKRFIIPIKSISNEATRFAKENSASDTPIDENKIKINELSELSTAINDMESETLKYIENLAEANAEKGRMGAELHVASIIQEGSIPTVFPDRCEFDIFASMTPAKEVGGDFYDFFFIDDEHLAIVMADVSGKGVPAALFMMVTKILINERALLGGTPSEILNFLNDRICDNNKAEMFVTVWLGILNVKTGRVIAANAGHDNPAIYRKNGNFEITKNKHGFVIGGIKNVKYTDFEFTLNKGDKLFLYTDGVPEATNAEQQMFGENLMIRSLNEYKDNSPKQLIKGVWSEINAFVKDAPQFDDVTMLCVEFKGENGERTLNLPATDENLNTVLNAVREEMEKADFSPKAVMQIEIAVEEIFVNICHYAYAPNTGNAEVKIAFFEDKLTITFTDSGKPYNPMEKPDPDITLSAEERNIGGLGIYMVKNLADDCSYQYKDGKNILKLEKKKNG